MTKKLLIISALFIVLTGCTKVYPINSTIPASIQFTSNDIVIGDVVSHTMKYDPKDSFMNAKLYKEALVKSGYDFILLPQYEIKTSAFSKTITITGYGANIKNSKRK